MRKELSFYLLTVDDLMSIVFVGNKTDLDGLNYYVKSGGANLVIRNQARFVEYLKSRRIFANAEAMKFQGGLPAWKFNRLVSREGIHMTKLDFFKAGFLVKPQETISARNMSKEMALEWIEDNCWLDEFDVDISYVRSQVERAFQEA